MNSAETKNPAYNAGPRSFDNQYPYAGITRIRYVGRSDRFLSAGFPAPRYASNHNLHSSRRQGCFPIAEKTAVAGNNVHRLRTVG